LIRAPIVSEVCQNKKFRMTLAVDEKVGSDCQQFSGMQVANMDCHVEIV
jgi:hypothetical protein